MRAVTLSTAALLAACSAGPPLLLGDADAETVAQALDAAWRAHFAAARQGDLDAVMALYHDDTIYAVPGMPVVSGGAELRRMERHGLAQGELVGAVHTTEALRVEGNTAFELGVVRGVVQPRGEPPQQVTFHYTAAWQPDDAGRWRILTITGQVPAAPEARP